MYIPAAFEVKDREMIISFIKEFPFATIITRGSAYPLATHLPFLIEEKEQKELLLLSHIAAINPHCEELKKTGNESLVIFHGPHAYISPQWYENKNSVPTWNYSAIHVYGNITFTDEVTENYNFLKKLVSYFEPGFTEKFENLPQQYVQALMQEIKVFSLKVNRMEACFKLSQNKTLKDQQNIVSNLETSERLADKELADFMLKNINRQ